MSFRITRSSGIEPSRRRSLSQSRASDSLSSVLGSSSLSSGDYRTPSVSSSTRRPYSGFGGGGGSGIGISSSSATSGIGTGSYYSPASNGSASLRYNPSSYPSAASGNSSSSSGSPYISKYSNYDNGVTVAGLNFTPNGGGGAVGGSSGSSSRYLLGGSNASLNITSPYSTASSLYRSHSLREQERKSRSRNRTVAANKIMSKRSMSASSEKSEGYEVRDNDLLICDMMIVLFNLFLRWWNY